MPPKKAVAATLERPNPNDNASAGENALSEAPSVNTSEDATQRQIQALQAQVKQLTELLMQRGPQARSPARARQRSSPTYSDISDVSAKSRSPPSPPIHEPRVTKPNKFSGKPSEFLSFITQCDATFAMCPKSYAKGETKVLFIITNLDGSALRWAREIIDDEQHPYRKDYQAFRSALFSLYDNRAYRLDAEDKLWSIKQTKSASAYAVEFQTLAAAAGYKEDTLSGWFFKGLNPSVKKAIIQQGRANTFEVQ